MVLYALRPDTDPTAPENLRAVCQMLEHPGLARARSAQVGGRDESSPETVALSWATWGHG